MPTNRKYLSNLNKLSVTELMKCVNMLWKYRKLNIEAFNWLLHPYVIHNVQQNIYFVSFYKKVYVSGSRPNKYIKNISYTIICSYCTCIYGISSPLQTTQSFHRSKINLLCNTSLERLSMLLIPSNAEHIGHFWNLVDNLTSLLQVQFQVESST